MRVSCQILAKGQLQVSKEERDAQLHGLFREVATIISDKCVNPDTQRPYTVSQIERTMRDLHVNINGSQSQAVELIRRLQDTIPLERARMSVRLVIPGKEAKKLKSEILSLVATVEHEDYEDGLEMVRHRGRGQVKMTLLLFCANPTFVSPPLGRFSTGVCH